MLSKKKLIEKVGIEYKPMIDQIDIADFTKCIAQLSNIYIANLKDEIIEEYLSTWCKNKKRFFDLMGGNVKVDMPIKYEEQDKDYEDKFLEVGREFPAFYPWCAFFKNHLENKICYSLFPYSYPRNLISEAFQNNISSEGMSITHFFKQYLKAPDEVVTKIAAIFENKEIEANFTISIDPVDMMLASENPYGWTSCYRLENDFQDSHADGCLAAVLDSTSLITYVWNNSGKFSLYDNYNFKNIRYKRMRMTIAISDNFKAIHFNTIYPGKGNYNEDFKKEMRGLVEKFVSEKMNFRNMWKRNDNNITIYRDNGYGYDEYDEDRIWIQSDYDTNNEVIKVFDEPIICPCGCGHIVFGTYPEEDDDDYEYNGNGYIYENFNYYRYCEYCDERQDCDGNCENCYIYNINNAVCELNNEEECRNRDLDEAEYEGDANFNSNNVVSPNASHCYDCPLFKFHKPEYFIDVKIKSKTDNSLYKRIDKKWYKEEDNGTLTEIPNGYYSAVMDRDVAVLLDLEENDDDDCRYCIISKKENTNNND